MNGKTLTATVIVPLPEEIDIATSVAAAADLLRAIGDSGLGIADAMQPRVVIADMTGTTFCDSSGLAMLVHVSRHAKASHTALRIVIPPGSKVMRPLTILGLEKMLPIYPSLGEAAARD